jgi:hypothetical protein
MCGTRLQLLRRERVDVLVERIAWIDAVLDAVEAGHHHRGEREVRVARRVGEANLDAARLGRVASTTGMRIDAERLRLEYARLTGAS